MTGGMNMTNGIAVDATDSLLLDTLAANPQASQRELAAACYLAQSSVRYRLATLRARGLIEAVPGKMRSLRLTAAGRRLVTPPNARPDARGLVLAYVTPFLDTPDAFPTVRALADAVGLHTHTVYRALRQLRADGLLPAVTLPTQSAAKPSAVKRAGRERDKAQTLCTVECCRAERAPGKQWCEAHAAAFVLRYRKAG